MTLPIRVEPAAPLPTRTLTAAIFDDEPAARAGYGFLLAADDIAVMVAEPLDETIAEARLGEAGQLDIAMVATGGPEGTGVAFARALARRPAAPPILLLADDSSELDLAGVLSNGAGGLVCRRCDIDRVVRGMRAVAAGGLSVECPDNRAVDPPHRLSNRERRIVTEFARGRSTEEVAASLWVSPHTVRTHMRNVQRKLDARTRTHAVAIAVSLGEVSRAIADE